MNAKRSRLRLLVAFVCGAVLGAAALLWVVLPPHQPRYQGRTIAQWLRILSSEPGRSGSPLDIIRVHVDTNLYTSIEVPLSYELLRKHNFLDGSGKIYLIVDHDNTTVHQLGQTNGNCLFPLPRWGIQAGMHEVTVEFVLWTGVDQYVSARGSPRGIAFDNNPASR